MHTHTYIYTYIYIKDIETSTKEHILHHDAQSLLKTVTQKRKIQAEDKELTELAHRKTPRLIKVWYEAASFCNS